MRKLVLFATICVSLAVTPFFWLKVVRAATRVNSIYDVKLGMNVDDAMSGLKGRYAVSESSVNEPDMRLFTITGGPDPHHFYSIYALHGRVASVWTEDDKRYSGDTLIVGNELFDALYSAAQPRRDKIGEALGIRELNLSVEMQKPVFDSSSRSIILDLPDEDFRFLFLNAPNGAPNLSIQRVKSLDQNAMKQLSETHSSSANKTK